MIGIPERARARRPKADALALAVVFGVVGLFYGWTVASGKLPSLGHVVGMTFSATSEEYYPLLAQGFLHGHLSLEKTPSPEFLAIDDPWDPAKTGALRLPDATYYKGRYYLYFGPTPVLLFFLPINILLGLYPSHSVAVVVFSLMGYGLSLLLLGALRRRYFSGVPIPWLVAAALILGFASAVPQMLRRPDVWEVAISCGYLMLCSGLCAVYLAAVRRSSAWLALASLCFGLAIASRPTLLLCPVALLFPLAAILRHRKPGVAWLSALPRVLLPSFLVLAACLFGIFGYNYERFGDPLEFGQRYQMRALNDHNTAFISPRFIPFNARVYFLSPPQLSSRFPFVSGIAMPDQPKGQLGIEGVYGLLPAMPGLLAAFALVGLFGATVRSRYPGLGGFSGAVASVALVNCAFVLLFAGACNRYQVDFAPYLALLAALGLLLLVRELSGSTRSWTISRAVIWGACAMTVACSTLVSIEHNAILRTHNRAAWRAMSRVANSLPFLIDRASGLKSGPVALSIEFPERESGTETLLTSGHGKDRDTLSVHYIGKGRVRLGMDHEGFGGPMSPPIEVGSQKIHTLLLDLGALYPDYDFRFYAGAHGVTSEALGMRLYAKLDDQVVFSRRAAFDSPNVADTRWGWQEGVDSKERFTGKITETRWLRAPVDLPTRDPRKPLLLWVTFPSGKTHSREPVFSTGRAGYADLFYVDYVDDHRIRFALDHWSAGATTWPAVDIDYSKPHFLRIAVAHLCDGGSPTSIRVDMDGRQIIDEVTPFYSVEPDEVYVGYAPYLNSSCGLEFTGTLKEAGEPTAHSSVAGKRP